MVKHNAILSFRGKKVLMNVKKNSKPTRSFFSNKMKKQDNLERVFHAKVLNEHKADAVSALRSISNSDQWIFRHNVKYELTHCLDYFYDEEESARNDNLLLENSQVLANIGYSEAPGIVFVDLFVSQELKKIDVFLSLNSNHDWKFSQINPSSSQLKRNGVVKSNSYFERNSMTRLLK